MPNRIIGCISTKNKEFKPRLGSKVAPCQCCKTLCWLSPEEEGFKKNENREVWCSACVETKSTAEDNVIGQKSQKYDPKNIPESQAAKDQKDANQRILENVDSQLAAVCAAAMQCLNPMGDPAQMIIMQVLRTFVEDRIQKMVEAKNSTLRELLQEKYSMQEAAVIATFVCGMREAGRKWEEPKPKRPSWFKDSSETSIGGTSASKLPGFTEWTVE